MVNAISLIVLNLFIPITIMSISLLDCFAMVGFIFLSLV